MSPSPQDRDADPPTPALRARVSRSRISPTSPLGGANGLVPSPLTAKAPSGHAPCWSTVGSLRTSARRLVLGETVFGGLFAGAHEETRPSSTSADASRWRRARPVSAAFFCLHAILEVASEGSRNVASFAQPRRDAQPRLPSTDSRRSPRRRSAARRRAKVRRRRPVERARQTRRASASVSATAPGNTIGEPRPGRRRRRAMNAPLHRWASAAARLARALRLARSASRARGGAQRASGAPRRARREVASAAHHGMPRRRRGRAGGAGDSRRIPGARLVVAAGL